MFGLFQSFARRNYQQQSLPRQSIGGSSSIPKPKPLPSPREKRYCHISKAVFATQLYTTLMENCSPILGYLATQTPSIQNEYREMIKKHIQESICYAFNDKLHNSMKLEPTEKPDSSAFKELQDQVVSDLKAITMLSTDSEGMIKTMIEDTLKWTVFRNHKAHIADIPKVKQKLAETLQHDRCVAQTTATGVSEIGVASTVHHLKGFFSVKIPSALEAQGGTLLPLLKFAATQGGKLISTACNKMRELPENLHFPVGSGDYKASKLDQSIVLTLGRYGITMGASYKGKHYKPHNEDRFVTTGDRNLTCDGVGGKQDGAAAAAAVSNQFLKAIEANPTLPDTEIAQLARQQLNQNPAISDDSSTCVVSTTISAPDIAKNPELRTVEFKQWGDCNAVLFKRTIQTGAITIEGSTQDPGFTLLDKLMYGSRGAAPYKQYIKTRHQIDGSVGKSEITPPKTTVFSISLTPEVEYFVINGSDGLFDNATPAHLTQLFLEVGKAGKSLPMAAMMQQIQYYHELRLEEAALLKIQSQINNIATPAHTKIDTLTQIEIVQNTERIDIQTKLDILNQAETNNTSIDTVCTQRLKEIQEKLARYSSKAELAILEKLALPSLLKAKPDNFTVSITMIA